MRLRLLYILSFIFIVNPISSQSISSSTKIIIQNATQIEIHGTNLDNVESVGNLTKLSAGSSTFLSRIRNLTSRSSSHFTIFLTEPFFVPLGRNVKLRMTVNGDSITSSSTTIGVVGPSTPTISASTDEFAKRLKEITISGAGFAENVDVILSGTDVVPDEVYIKSVTYSTLILGWDSSNATDGLTSLTATIAYNDGTLRSTSETNIATIVDDTPVITSPIQRVALGASLNLEIEGSYLGDQVRTVVDFTGDGVTSSCASPSLASDTKFVCPISALALGPIYATFTKDGQISSSTTQIVEKVPTPSITSTDTNIQMGQTTLHVYGTNLEHAWEDVELHYFNTSDGTNLMSTFSHIEFSEYDNATEFILVLSENTLSNGTIVHATFYLWGMEFDVSLGTIAPMAPVVTASTKMWSQVETKLTIYGTGFGRGTDNVVLSGVSPLPDGYYVLRAGFDYAVISMDASSAGLGTLSASIRAPYNHDPAGVWSAFQPVATIVADAAVYENFDNIAYDSTSFFIYGTGFQANFNYSGCVTRFYVARGSAPAASYDVTFIDSGTLEVTWTEGNGLVSANAQGLGWLSADLIIMGIDVRSIVLGTVSQPHPVLDKASFSKRSFGANAIEVQGVGLNSNSTLVVTSGGSMVNCAIRGSNPVPVTSKVTFECDSFSILGNTTAFVKTRYNDLSIKESDPIVIANVVSEVTMDATFTTQKVSRGALRVTIMGAGFQMAPITTITWEVGGYQTPKTTTPQTANLDIEAVISLDFPIHESAYGVLYVTCRILGKLFERIPIAQIVSRPTLVERRTNIDKNRFNMTLWGTNLDATAYQNFEISSFDCDSGTPPTMPAVSAGLSPITQLQFTWTSAQFENCVGELKITAKLWGVDFTSKVIGTVALPTPVVTYATTRYAVGASKIVIDGNGFSSEASVTFSSTGLNPPEFPVLKQTNPIPSATSITFDISTLDSDSLGNVTAVVKVPYNHNLLGVESMPVQVARIVQAPTIPDVYDNIDPSSNSITIHGSGFHHDSQIDVTQIVGESSVHPVPASTTPISITAFEVLVSSLSNSQGFLLANISMYGLEFRSFIGIVTSAPDLNTTVLTQKLAVGATEIVLNGHGFNELSTVSFSSTGFSDPSCNTYPTTWTSDVLTYTCTALTSSEVGVLTAVVTSPDNDGSTSSSGVQIATIVEAPSFDFLSSTKIAVGATKITISGANFHDSASSFSNLIFSVTSGTVPTTSVPAMLDSNMYTGANLLIVYFDAPLDASGILSLSFTFGGVEFTLPVANIVPTPTITASNANLPHGETSVLVRGTNFDSDVADALTYSFATQTGPTPTTGTVTYVDSATLLLAIAAPGLAIDSGELRLSGSLWGIQFDEILIASVSGTYPTIDSATTEVSISGSELTIFGSGFLPSSTVVFSTANAYPVNPILKMQDPLPSPSRLVYTFDSISGSGTISVQVSSLYNDESTISTPTYVVVGASNPGPTFTASSSIISYNSSTIVLRGSNLGDPSAVSFRCDGCIAPGLVATEATSTTITLTVGNPPMTDFGTLYADISLFGEKFTDISLGVIGPEVPSVFSTSNTQHIALSASTFTIFGEGFHDASEVIFTSSAISISNAVVDSVNFTTIVVTCDSLSGTPDNIVSAQVLSHYDLENRTTEVAVPIMTIVNDAAPTNTHSTQRIAVGANEIYIHGANFGTDGSQFRNWTFTCAGINPQISGFASATPTLITVVIKNLLACDVGAELGAVFVAFGIQQYVRVATIVGEPFVTNMVNFLIPPSGNTLTIYGQGFDADLAGDLANMTLFVSSGPTPIVTQISTGTNASSEVELTLSVELSAHSGYMQIDRLSIRGKVWEPLPLGMFDVSAPRLDSISPSPMAIGVREVTITGIGLSVLASVDCLPDPISGEDVTDGIKLILPENYTLSEGTLNCQSRTPYQGGDLTSSNTISLNVFNPVQLNDTYSNIWFENRNITITGIGIVSYFGMDAEVIDIYSEGGPSLSTVGMTVTPTNGGSDLMINFGFEAIKPTLTSGLLTVQLRVLGLDRPSVAVGRFSERYPSINTNSIVITEGETRLNITGTDLNEDCTVTWVSSVATPANTVMIDWTRNRMEFEFDALSATGDGALSARITCPYNDGSQRSTSTQQVANILKLPTILDTSSSDLLSQNASEIRISGTYFSSDFSGYSDLFVTCGSSVFNVDGMEFRSATLVFFNIEAPIWCQSGEVVSFEFSFHGISVGPVHIAVATSPPELFESFINLDAAHNNFDVWGSNFIASTGSDFDVSGISCESGTWSGGIPTITVGNSSWANLLFSTSVGSNGCQGRLVAEAVRLWGMLWQNFTFGSVAPEIPIVNSSSSHVGITATRITITGIGFNPHSTISFSSTGLTSPKRAVLDSWNPWELVWRVDALTSLQEGTVSATIKSRFQSSSAVDHDEGESSEVVICKIILTPTILSSTYNLPRTTGILPLVGTGFQADAATSIIVENVTVEEGIPPSVADVSKGETDNELYISFGVGGVLNAYGLLRADITLYGVHFPSHILASISDESPVVDEVNTTVPVGSDRITITGTGFNMHSTVTFDSTSEVPRNPKIVTSGPSFVTWSEMVIEFDPVDAAHIGTLSVIVDSPYLLDTDGALSQMTQVAEIVDTIPVAPSMIIESDYGDEIVMTFDPESGGTTGTLDVVLTSLPDAGTLWDLHYNFRTHGYMPRVGTQVKSVPWTVHRDRQIVFRAPSYFDMLNFTYVVVDNSTSKRTSANGWVVVMSPDNTATCVTNFTNGAEGWTAGTVQDQRAVVWSGTSVGALNHFIYSDGGASEVGEPLERDWRFFSPSSFRKNHLLSYNGQLQFWLNSFVGDFENYLRPNPHSFISIQCASCNGGLGIELAQREVAYTGGLQFFNFTLNEETKFGWRKNPRDSRISEWPNPTQCEFLQVLISMDRIDIMGDFTDGYETIALDQPQFLIGDGNIPTPTGCYNLDL